MEGLDYAFYKGRSSYHTRLDSIPGAGAREKGGNAKKALWAMMETARGAGSALANDERTHRKSGDAVYFDRESLFMDRSCKEVLISVGSIR
jgi:hypothetical protein